MDTFDAFAGKGASRPHSKIIPIISFCLTGFRLSVVFDEDKYKTARVTKPMKHAAFIIRMTGLDGLDMLFVIVLRQPFEI